MVLEGERLQLAFQYDLTALDGRQGFTYFCCNESNENTKPDFDPNTVLLV